MIYDHNIVQKLKAYIFVQSHLKEFLDWKGSTLCGYAFEKIRLPAKEISERVRQQLQDKKGLAIDEVEIITDKSKAEIMSKVLSIKDNAEKLVKDSNCKLGLVFCTIGFMIWETDHKDLLTKIEAPLQDKTLAHHYVLTT